MGLLIWSNASLPPPAERLLREVTAGHDLYEAPSLAASNLVSGPIDASLQGAEVIFGQPDPNVVAVAPKLSWIHLTSAGYTRYDDESFRQAMVARGIRLTTSSTVYAGPCAEHVLAMMLGISRQLPVALETQRTSRAWPMSELRAACRLLAGQQVVMLGFGAIARRLCELLSPFAVEITAFRRNVRAVGPPGVTFVDERGLEAALGRADHVVDLLPDSAPTLSFVNAARLGMMKPGAHFYNVGRGNTVDQSALIEALETERLASAYLDVTTPEPLPVDHPLWAAPRCYITPHIAGGHHDEAERLVRHFGDNLAAFVDGRPLRDQVIGPI
jgi:phosphoglycerate dehydrogenase-like enzyme